MTNLIEYETTTGHEVPKSAGEISNVQDALHWALRYILRKAGVTGVENIENKIPPADVLMLNRAAELLNLSGFRARDFRSLRNIFDAIPNTVVVSARAQRVADAQRKQDFADLTAGIGEIAASTGPASVTIGEPEGQ